MSRPLRVAVVGAGPAGMYAAGHLLEGPGGTYLDGRLVRLTDREIEVDVLDRLVTPGGLLRHGVAPDHPEKKLVQTVFEAVAQRPGFRYFGNVEVGRDVRPQELSEWYDAVVYAFGATGDTHLGIPGEELDGCWSARELVAWYNGHPDHSGLDLDFSHERAVIVGNGNVAMDVARILTTDPYVLARTDIADHALEALRASKVREVVVLGRRAHFHGAFNNPELEELGQIDGVDVIVEGSDLPDELDLTVDDADPATRRKLATLLRFSQRPPEGHERRIVLRFLSSPLEVLGTERTEGLLVSRNRLEHAESGGLSIHPTGDESVIETGLVLRAVGYFGQPLPGLPFDEHRGVVPHQDGRVMSGADVVPGTYVTGWIKRGPRGIIGTNKKCARDTVLSLLADADSGLLPTDGTLDAAAVDAVLRGRQPEFVDATGWLRLDDHERRAGHREGRPRVKQVELSSQINASKAAPSS